MGLGHGARIPGRPRRLFPAVMAVATLAGIEGALASVGRGVVVLDGEGCCAHAPAWAHAALAEHFGSCGPGGLPDPVASWVLEQRQQLFSDGRPRLRPHLVSTVDDRQLSLRFVPGAAGRSDVVVLEEHEPARGVAELRRLGLTAREAELLWLLSRGFPTNAIAKDLGVSPATVNKHLQNIYRKLGVSNRAGAIAAATDAVFSPR